ncbi:hypothetical protein SprV_0301186800 [Sparganum proliferum]
MLRIQSSLGGVISKGERPIHFQVKCSERDPHGSLGGVEGGGSWCARCEFLQLKAQRHSMGTVAVLRKGTSADKDDDSSLASEPLLGLLNQSAISLDSPKSLPTESSAHPSAESFHEWIISPREYCNKNAAFVWAHAFVFLCERDGIRLA